MDPVIPARATTDQAGGAPLSGARIAVIVTAPSSAGFFTGQLAALRRAGADVTFVSSPSEEVSRQCVREGARYVAIAMERAPSPMRDAIALATMTRMLSRLQPHIVNAGTPKAGLLGMLGAVGARTPVRVHTLHGLRYETARGLGRRVLWAAQRASCDAATHVLCVSRSLRDRAVQTRLLRPGQGIVLGDGSVNGVDIEALQRTPETTGRGAQIRRSAGIPQDAFVVGYLGRLARDKGVRELGEAWRTLRETGARLLIAGGLDDTDPPDEVVRRALRDDPTVSELGVTADRAGFLAACDLLVLPSYREGLPTAPLEAAAMELPVVATAVTGCVDAVEDGLTGTLIPVGDTAALADAIARYLHDPARCEREGVAGRRRVVERFANTRIHDLMIAFYRRLLG